MLDFECYNPTHIIIGADTVPALTEQVAADAHMLVLCRGASAEKSGTLASRP